MPDFDLDSALSPPDACPFCDHENGFRKFIGDHRLDLRRVDGILSGRCSPTAYRPCLNPDCRKPLALEYAPEWSSLAEEQGLPLERGTVAQCPNCRDPHMSVELPLRSFILPRIVLSFDCPRCHIGWATRYRPNHYRKLGVS